MAADTEQVILEVIVKNDDALKRIKENKEDIAELREAQALLNKSTEEGKKQWQDYEKEIKSLRRENALLTKEVRDNNKSIQDQEGSLKSMRSELSLLNKVYVNLSKTERESAKGRELQEKILSLSTTIGDAEKKLGDFRRQVGNYENAITSALGANNKYVATLVAMKNGNMNLGSALKVATSSVVSFGKALYAAIFANPIVAVIAGIVAALTGLIKIMRGNEEQSARLDAVLAPLKRTFEGIVAVLQIVAGWVLDVAEGFEALAFQATKLGEKIPVIGKYFKQSNDAMLASIQLAKDKAALDKQTRALEVANAKAQYESSELRKKAEDRVKYTAEERLKFVQEANAKEKEILDNRLKIAEEQFRIAQEEASYNENSKEANEKLAEMEANLYLVRKEYSDRTKELITKENEIRNQSITTEKSRLDNVKKATEEAKKQKQKELEIIRQAEDAAFALVKEGIEKQTQAINTEYDRQIADIKIKLETEKKLTADAKEALNNTIISLEEQRTKKLKELSDQSLQDQIKKETERIQLQLDAVKAGSEQEHQLRVQLIEQNRQAELAANLQLAEELRQSESDINAAYNKQVADENDAFRKDQYNKQVEMLKLEWENRLLQVREGSSLEYDLKVQQAQAEYDALINMDAATKAAMFKSDAEYTNAVLQNKKKLQDATKAQINAENEAVLAQMEAASIITDAFSSMIDTFAEDNERLAAFSKSIALFNIGISTAKAIADGVASASSAQPWFMIPVAIATTLATVMANIAKAKQLVAKEKEPKYADGGEITGPSHVNGGVHIEAEGGEAIINKRSMSNPLLRSIASAVNVAGGGVPFSNVPILPSSTGTIGIDQDALKQAFTEALKDMPSPVVSVVEISQVQNRVKTIENNASL
jgi:myosin heavy subunit